MGKKVLIILANGFEEMEAIAPMDLLRRAGIEVTIAGLSGSTIKSARGVSVLADTILDQVSGSFDALVLPGGGEGAKNLAASKKVKDIILEHYRKGKEVCAICASPVLVLSHTGILNGKFATCYQGMESGFDKSVRYSDQTVVVDGNIITSKGPATAIAFALSIVEKLCGKEESQKIRKDILA